MKAVVKYNWVGVRGTDEELKIGEVLKTSFLWDYEKDVSTAETENPIELGGVCALSATLDGWDFYDVEEREENLEEAIALIQKRAQENINTYGYEYVYLIGCQTLATDYEAPDAFEIHMKRPVVIAKL